jgi:hypothetical protein
MNRHREHEDEIEEQLEESDAMTLMFAPDFEMTGARCEHVCAGRRWRYLIANGLTGEPTAPVIGSAGATNRNS